MYNNVAPSQVHIFLENVWVDDACSIEYAQVTGKEAYYGYNDSMFRTVATSRSIITGAITINFRYVGYLMRVISSLGNLTEVNGKNIQKLYKIVGEVSLGTAASEDYEGWITRVIEDDPSALGIVQSYLQNNFWGDVTTTSDFDWAHVEPTTVFPTNPRFKYKGLYFVCMYGPDGLSGDSNRIEVIKDVHFTGTSKRIDNSRAEFGSSPVVERYEFIARSVEPR